EALEEEVLGVIEERKLGAECDAWSESRCLRAGEVDQREPGVGLLNKPPVETPERSERNADRPAPTSAASGRSGLVANGTPGAGTEASRLVAVAHHQRERATTLDQDALLERGDVRSRKERLESDVARRDRCAGRYRRRSRTRRRT